jgi:hypothetical protein
VRQPARGIVSEEACLPSTLSIPIQGHSLYFDEVRFHGFHCHVPLQEKEEMCIKTGRLSWNNLRDSSEISEPQDSITLLPAFFSQRSLPFASDLHGFVSSTAS